MLLPGIAALRVEAQSVGGVVTDSGPGSPLAGAMVVLFEDGGKPVDRSLTDAAGKFTTDAKHPGLYYMRVDRIGYASLTTDVFEVPVTGTYREISVPIQPIQLRGLDVSGSRRCEVRPEDGRVTAQVWEEARKALVAAAWTQSTGIYRYTLLHYIRDLDRDGKQIVDETRSFSRGSLGAPFESLPVDDLINNGFVQQSLDAVTVYHAPDAEAFLSDAFLDTHCLGTRRGEGGLIGLSFAPIDGRDLPEIKGVLWLDEETAQLDRLEFTYVNLRPDLETGERGGEVIFTRLPNGTWIVRDWWIRMPLLGQSRLGIRRIGYRDEGGVAWRVADRSGEIVLEASTATISGTVMDSIKTGPPPAPVSVQVAGTGETVTTRADGSFILPGLPVGLQKLQVRHPLLDTLGLAAPTVFVQTVLGEMVHVSMRVPRVAEALAESCGGGPRPDQTAPLFGRIVGESGRPLQGVTVATRWFTLGGFQPTLTSVPAGPNGEAGAEWVVGRDEEFTTVKTETDARGIFVLCDVPHGSRLPLDVTTRDGKTATRRPLVPRGSDVAFITVKIEEGR